MTFSRAPLHWNLHSSRWITTTWNETYRFRKSSPFITWIKVVHRVPFHHMHSFWVESFRYSLFCLHFFWNFAFKAIQFHFLDLWRILTYINFCCFFLKITISYYAWFILCNNLNFTLIKTGYDKNSKIWQKLNNPARKF